MGYQTDFEGEFGILPTLTPDHLAYLKQFSEIRHMKRDIFKLVMMPDPLRNAVGLPLGLQGAYYVGEADKYASQAKDDSVIDSNEPPGSPARRPGPFDYNQYLQDKAIALATPGACPGLWCQWTPDVTGNFLGWDEGEKFYDYIEWAQYLLENFLTPWGYALAGAIYWYGEDNDDRGRIVIESPSNALKVERGHLVYR